MKRKFAILFLVIALCIGGLACLSGCCSLTGHAWDDGEVLTQPTCTEEGEVRYTCTECGETKTERMIANGHTYSEWTFEGKHLCTEEAEATRTCTNCNHTESKTVTATAHTYGDWQTTTPATCTTDGEARRDCTKCDHYETNHISATGHTFGNWIVTTYPTCTQDGERTKTCSKCDYYETDSVPAGHTFGSWQTTTPATCTTDGEERRDCTKCDHYEINTISATGHSFDEWQTTTPVTCTTDGEERRDCTKCDHYEINTLSATGHSFGEWQTTTPVTCTTDGEERRDCTKCDHYEINTLSATGHTDTDKNKLCDVCTKLVAEDATPISSVADLKNIANNLSGSYYLTTDVSLSEETAWTPIGSANAPFKGIFHGYGYTISGLNLSTASVSGLFAYNSGMIYDLTIKDFSIAIGSTLTTDDGIPEASNTIRKKIVTIERYAGLLVAVNNGTISKCTVSGTNSITSSSLCYANDPNSTLIEYSLNFQLYYTASMGGFAAVNHSTITNCSLTGSLTNNVTADAYYNHQVPIGYTQTDNDISINNSNVACGGIVGRNESLIEYCTISCNIRTNNSATAELDHRNWHIGQCHTNLTIATGSIAGENRSNGKINNTKHNNKVAVSSRSGVDVNDGNKIAKSTIITPENNYGYLIGSNSGTVSDITIIE